MTTPCLGLALAGGEPLSVSAPEQFIKNIGRQAGVERLHPNLLRHTFACPYLMRYRGHLRAQVAARPRHFAGDQSLL